jgi:Flp pilus assembly CpaE family ATPase
VTETERPRLLLGVRPIAEGQIRDALFGTDRTVAVVASAVEAAELSALAEHHTADAVLVSPNLSGLEAGHCARLRAAGLCVIGLALDERDAATLTTLGIDAVLTPPLTADELAHACQPSHRSDQRDEAEHASQLAAHLQPPAASHAAVGREKSGSVVAVVAAGRSAGGSECACSLAALLDRRWPTLLVECDLGQGGLALRVGADPQQGSLLGLVRASPGADREELARMLARWTIAPEQWPSLLVAPPDVDRDIDELAEPGAIRAALAAAASAYPLVIADVGSLLATAGDVPKIAHCHREALVSADAVLLVVGARDDQLQAGRAQLARLTGGLGVKPERLRICVNGLGAPGAASRTEAQAALAEELAGLQLAVDGWLPYDRRALARARKSGLPLALARRHSPYTHALSQLLDMLFIADQPVTRRRQYTLRVPAPARLHRARASHATHALEIDEEVPLPWRS